MKYKLLAFILLIGFFGFVLGYSTRNYPLTDKEKLERGWIYAIKIGPDGKTVGNWHLVPKPTATNTPTPVIPGYRFTGIVLQPVGVAYAHGYFKGRPVTFYCGGDNPKKIGIHYFAPGYLESIP